METEVSGRVTEDRVMAWTKGNLEVEIFSFVNDRCYLNLIIALRIINLREIPGKKKRSIHRRYETKKGS